NLARLAVAEAGAALAVADHHQRRETEALAALHGLGHAVDVDELLDQLLAAIVVAAAPATVVAPATAAAVSAATPTSAAAATTAATARLPLLDSRRFRRSFGLRLLGAFLSHFRGFSLLHHLELQSAFAGSVGEGLHPAMEEEAAAVEHDLADAGLLRPVRARLALDFLVERRGGGQRLARAVVDHLRVDVTARAVDRQPRLAGGARPERGAHPTAAAFEEGKFGHGYFFLPSLRKIYSPRYLMPLPLYGSGLRQRRISAATWPTFCLSMPLISTVFWSGVFTSMPSGSL